MRRYIYSLMAVIPVAGLVALTYYYFEAAVHHSINYIWYTLLNTNTYRWLVIPTCVVLTLCFFLTQHLLDKKSETHESEGLVSKQKPTIANYIIVIIIGFLSLLAGASLGPEAILVPASMIIGAYIGTKLFKKNSTAINLLSVAAFVALFTAFFHSFIFGLLGLLLIAKVEKLKLDIKLLIVAIISSLSALVVLHLLSSAPYAGLPQSNWKISSATILTVVCLVVAGYLITYILKYIHDYSKKFIDVFSNNTWWEKAIIASIVLSIIYILGGHLIEFTGNESIVPMLNQAQSLGYIGLLWIFITKLLAISWSKAAGYRGGLIFATAFAASVVVAFSQLISRDINFNYALIAVLIGAFASNNKLKYLF